MRQATAITLWLGYASLATAGGAGEAEWLPLFGERPEFGTRVIAPYDDGFVGAGVDIAQFNEDGSLEYNVLRFWRDGEWTSAGSVGPNPSLKGDEIDAIGVFNRDVCIGGSFSNLPPDNHSFFSCWSVDGEFWYRPGQGGPNGPVQAIEWEGSSRLYVGGAFTEVLDTQGDPVSAKGIVETDGFDWAPLFNQGLIDNGVANNNVSTIRLGGGFVYVIHGSSVSQWNRTLPKWDLLGTANVPGGNPIRDAAFFGTELVVAGGGFNMMDGAMTPNVAKSVPSPMSSWDTFDENVGPGEPALGVEMAFGFLYSHGDWSALSGGDELARWTGQAWVAEDTAALGQGFRPQDLVRLGAGDLCLEHQGLGLDPTVYSTSVVCKNGVNEPWTGVSRGLSGATLGATSVIEYQGDVYAGGYFTNAGDKADVGKIARWDGDAWQRLGDGISATFGSGPNAVSVRALEVFGGDLVAAGVFDLAGGNAVVNLAAWDGSQWSGLGGGIFGTPAALLGHDGRLYVGGGNLSNGACTGGICAWNGAAFESVGGGTNSNVDALGIYQGDLVAGGRFSTAGGSNARGLARWDGSQWTELGGGISLNRSVMAIAARGNDLYVGGNFTAVGSPGLAVNSIARWDGSQWHALGSGVEGGFFEEVRALELVGGNLYAAGSFTTAGGVTANSTARWDGSQWHAVGPGLHDIDVLSPSEGSGSDLYLASDGRLYVAGAFSIAGTTYAESIGALNVNDVFADGFEGTSP